MQCDYLLQVMSDPVIAADGHSYDKICIERWLRTNNRSPMNNTVLQNKKLKQDLTVPVHFHCQTCDPRPGGKRGAI